MPICNLLFLLITTLGVRGNELPDGVVLKAGGDVLPAMPAVAEQFVSLKVPLRSPHFVDTPVALVNEEPITLAELAGSLGSPSNSATTEGEEESADYQGVLQRLINSMLIAQEARNIGLNETDSFRSQVKAFKIKTLQRELIRNHLEGLEPDPAEVEKVYKQISREVQLHVLTFESGAEAQRFLDELKEVDFDQLAEKYIEESKAKEEGGENYVKMKDLLPQVGQQVYAMEKGGVSNIFRTEKGFILFRLTDSRFVEDPSVEKEAIRIVLDSLRRQKAMEYSNSLSDKYVTFNEELYQHLDFDADFEELLQDERVLATVQGEEPIIITVADLATRLQANFFHGADKAQKLKIINERKDSTISNMLFSYTSELEAHRLGFDQTKEYQRSVETFERATLFKAFMDKVVLPDVKLNAEEVRSYYDEHIDEYSSPAMLRMSSLVFHTRQGAESALDKLRKGADFKWVSANATGFVPPETKGLLPFDEKLLSLTSLPADLQETAGRAKKGESLLYAAPEGDYYYVLVIEQTFPPEPQPYAAARSAVARVVFDKKTQQLINEWTIKLKEFYPTQIFLTDRGQ